MKRTLLALSIYCIALTANSQTVWAEKTTIDNDTGNNPYTIASGLIDADSNLDIVVGTDSDNIIVWYAGNGDGTFMKQAEISNSLINIGGVKLVDLNGDGNIDIIASGYGSYAAATLGVGSSLVWFEGNGTGGFGLEQLITNTYKGFSGLFIGSIDTGTSLDIAITAGVDNQVIWFSNDGSGSFTEETLSPIDNTLSAPGVVNLKDIDNDGDLDALVATAVYGGDVIEIFRNDLIPGGSVAWAKDAISVTTGKVGIFNASFEDLDGDANLDILATEISFGGGPSGNLYWFEADGTGYTETAFNSTTNNPSVAQAKDLDNDGLVDIILSSGALVDVIDLVWFKNNGDGTFGIEQVINDTQNQVYVYNVADFDGDNDLDIASNAYGADNLNYIENLLETLSISDFDVTLVKIYPNPTKDVLNFEGFNTASIEVAIYDILGKKVLNKSLNTNQTLDVSQLVSGIYSITVNGTFASKFIKE